MPFLCHPKCHSCVIRNAIIVSFPVPSRCHRRCHSVPLLRAASGDAAGRSTPREQPQKQSKSSPKSSPKAAQPSLSIDREGRSGSVSLSGSFALWAKGLGPLSGVSAGAQKQFVGQLSENHTFCHCAKSGAVPLGKHEENDKTTWETTEEALWKPLGIKRETLPKS